MQFPSVAKSRKDQAHPLNPSLLPDKNLHIHIPTYTYEFLIVFPLCWALSETPAITNTSFIQKPHKPHWSPVCLQSPSQPRTPLMSWGIVLNAGLRREKNSLYNPPCVKTFLLPQGQDPHLHLSTFTSLCTPRKTIAFSPTRWKLLPWKHNLSPKLSTERLQAAETQCTISRLTLEFLPHWSQKNRAFSELLSERSASSSESWIT